uniref:uncharacterized protein LOC105350689 n=1 Tax=Fragaria vesca subsp. vesca TaxID=101020 RepID=UPI0005C940F8|nr:PREDICTED: uncharacterized protein LOC105350689 [Fragaria vesca subsp. vesca]
MVNMFDFADHCCCEFGFQSSIKIMRFWVNLGSVSTKILVSINISLIGCGFRDSHTGTERNVPRKKEIGCCYSVALRAVIELRWGGNLDLGFQNLGIDVKTWALRFVLIRCFG